MAFLDTLQGLLGQANRNAFPARNFGLLTPEQVEQSQKDAKLATAASLLQASGPSSTPQNPMGNLGAALQVGREQQRAGEFDNLRNRLLKAQIHGIKNPEPDLGTITLEKGGESVTLRRADPQVDGLLRDNWLEVKTPASSVTINQGSEGVRTLTPEEVAANFPDMPPGTIVQIDAEGKISTPFKPTDAAVTAAAQRSSGMENLGRLRTLVENNDIDFGPWEAAQRKISAGSGLGNSGMLAQIASGALRAALGRELTEVDAQLLSLTESISNQLLAAMRGAQVGPAEQARFEQQLPLPWQDEKLFMENLANTERNLESLLNRSTAGGGNDVAGVTSQTPGEVLPVLSDGHRVTEEDIQLTMREEGMTRQQVLEALNGP